MRVRPRAKTWGASAATVDHRVFVRWVWETGTPGDQCRQGCDEGELVEGVEFGRPDLGVDGAVEAAQREFRGKG
ncbi:hypothetical protein SAMN06272781_0062 [Streptomyces sp. 1222.2]|nr:hypothetical protein SAMN06272781_0062 [Streptomyces sp. 1222.2]